MTKIVCRACGREVEIVERVGRREECPGCGADLHSCRQCRHHDPTRHNECREPMAERVVDKDKSNDCDYFSPGGGPPAASAGSGRQTAGKAAAEKQWEALFGKRK